MNVTEKEFRYMKEFIIRDMGFYLMDEYGMSVEKALDAIYGSKTYEMLCNPDSGLYYQSSQYVYQFLKEEITTGTFNMDALVYNT